MKIADNIVIRGLEEKDIEPVARHFAFPWTTIKASMEKWTRYYDEQIHGKRHVFFVEQEHKPIGYGSLVLFSEYPNFSAQNIPEISDVSISENYRGLGYGTLLISHFENFAKNIGYKQVGIGVGLYKDYGQAQKLYFKLGYMPDGLGITYKCMPVIAGQNYPVDDDLILWLIKNLG